MKTNLLTIVFLLLLFSCSSNPTDINSTNSQSITLSGKWLWIESSGGFGYHVVTPEAGTRVIETYAPDGQYSKYRNDTLIVSKNFVLRKQVSIYSRDSLDAIVFKDSTQPIPDTTTNSFVILRLTVDSLERGDNRYDGYGSLFVRTNQ